MIIGNGMATDFDDARPSERETRVYRAAFSPTRGAERDIAQEYGGFKKAFCEL